MKLKDRVVTASIGLKLSTIDTIEKRAAARKITFSAAGREIIEQALELEETSEKATEPAPIDALAILTEKNDAPI